MSQPATSAAGQNPNPDVQAEAALARSFPSGAPRGGTASSSLGPGAGSPASGVGATGSAGGADGFSPLLASAPAQTSLSLAPTSDPAPPAAPSSAASLDASAMPPSASPLSDAEVKAGAASPFSAAPSFSGRSAAARSTGPFKGGVLFGSGSGAFASLSSSTVTAAFAFRAADAGDAGSSSLFDDDLDGSEPSAGAGTAAAGGDADPNLAALVSAGPPLPAAEAAGAGAPGAVGSSAAADLAAQMAAKIAAPSTRFDLELNPAGLGKVAVAVEISAAGVMRASLSFEKPESASLLSTHAALLQQTLAQAGVSLSSADLSFTTTPAAGSGGAFSGGQPNDGSGGSNSGARLAGRAFGAAASALEQADPSSTGAYGHSASGVDIRI